MAVCLRASVTPITTGPAGINHFTTQIVIRLFELELVLKILIQRPTSETCLRFGFGFEQPEAGYARFQIFLHA
jgi:hypothetical protein